MHFLSEGTEADFAAVWVSILKRMRVFEGECEEF
jgi:hypothetical protein